MRQDKGAASYRAQHQQCAVDKQQWSNVQQDNNNATLCNLHLHHQTQQTKCRPAAKQ
jgi:hypothetical protein